MYYYRGYSLNIGSELPLPELPEAEGEPDVTIRFGKIPRTPRKATATDELAVNSHTGAYQITNGREIVVDPIPNAEPGAVRLLLLGRMMAYLLRQRGWLPLHASGVAVNGRGLLFLGDSGAGKSTMAAAFHASGHQVITDDVAPVRISGGRCILLSARPRLRLDSNSRVLMADEARQGVLEWDDKYLFDLSGRRLPEATDVHRIYVLTDGVPAEGAGIVSEPISPAQSVRLLSAHCFFKRRRMDSSALEAHLRDCAAVAGMATVRRLIRPRLLSKLPSLVEFVENDLANG